MFLYGLHLVRTTAQVSCFGLAQEYAQRGATYAGRSPLCLAYVGSDFLHLHNAVRHCIDREG